MASGLTAELSLNTSLTSEYERRIQKVFQYLQKHLDSPIDLDVLADVAAFSKFHFHRIFFAFTGETPADHLNRLRLEKAANLICTNPSMPLVEVGEKCGFSSQALFSRNFKKHFGVSPARYSTHLAKTLNNSKNSQNHNKNSKIINERSIYFSGVNIDNDSQKENMFMNIKIQHMPELRVASLVHSGGYSSDIGPSFTKLIVWANQKGLFSPATKFVGMPLDNPDITPAAKCRYKVALTIPDKINHDDLFEIETIPASVCVVRHFEGPENEISNAYNALYKEYLPQNGLIPEDFPGYEICLNDPQRDPEHKFIFDICIPVKKI